jgi:hypothetical protein
MRNLCDESVTVPGDLPVSFSDGLTVADATNGMVGLGQRAAVPTFALNGGETRRWTVTVKAADSLAAAPVHISEYYVGGRVLSRIDGVFIVPEPVVEAEAAPGEAPAPVPLPNTAGGLGSLLPQLLTAPGMAGAGVALRRRGSTVTYLRISTARRQLSAGGTFTGSRRRRECAPRRQPRRPNAVAAERQSALYPRSTGSRRAVRPQDHAAAVRWRRRGR